jgi:hypothetical protein
VAQCLRIFRGLRRRIGWSSNHGCCEALSDRPKDGRSGRRGPSRIEADAAAEWAIGGLDLGDLAPIGAFALGVQQTRVDVGDPAIGDRRFATARSRCGPSGETCGCRGVPKIQPRQLLQVGGPLTLAFLTCPRCIWKFAQAQLDKPPWSGSARHYRCPRCSRLVDWHIHGPAWRPGGSTSNRETIGDVRRP